MQHHNDECIWLRTEVLLDTGDGPPARVQTRKLCRSGVFVEYTGPITGQTVQITFPEPHSREGGRRMFGMVAHRWSDGVWIRFSRDLRSSAELMMRHGPARMARAPRTPVRPAHRL